MAIFAGKCIYGAAFELQSRVFVKPWAMMIIVRCCSNSDESSMNSPVRYTPKKSLKYNKVNDYTPAAKESKNFEVRRFTNPDSLYVEFSNAGERSSIGFSVHEKSLDNDFKEGHVISKEKKTYNSNVRLEVGEPDYKWRSADSKVMEEADEFDAMEGLDEDLDEHDSLNGEYEIKNLTIKTKEEAEKTAIRLLGARAYTALELKKKLIGKKFSDEVVNAVISDFQNRGFINDLLYAESFSRSRWSSSSWGPRRIKQALAKKGVNDLDAQKAIKVVLEDGESVPKFGLSKPSMDHLFAQVSKQWLRAKDLPTEKQKSRIINWLQYRGFNWGVINFILKKLQSEHPVKTDDG
ncbi:uncharacterized protein LOC111876065 isoform X2 [Lactuca sativa]|uniref:uncharacterized protein LOC111876065 isoform X2 n=1 Tax=Lactuca sativa TaxID=4236 RepID=UPI000CD8C5DE|nr:uncharacterized protein LOC111876065 isoform X2 [Lactuca sativa]